MIRCFSLIMLLSILHVSGAAFSQGTKLNISQKNVSIAQILNEIEKTSNFKFLYRNETVNVDKVIDINVKDADIETVLKSIFSEQEVFISYF